MYYSRQAFVLIASFVLASCNQQRPPCDADALRIQLREATRVLTVERARASRAEERASLLERMNTEHSAIDNAQQQKTELLLKLILATRDGLRSGADTRTVSDALDQFVKEHAPESYEPPKPISQWHQPAVP